MKNGLIDVSYLLFVWQGVLLISLILLVYSLVDILKHSFKGNDKIIWVLVVLFLPILGSILYLFLGRKQRLKLNSN